MRSWVVGLALLAGCGSENGLRLGLEPKSPVEEEDPPKDPPPPPSDEDATLRGQVCSPNGQGYVAHADVTVDVAPDPVTAQTGGDGTFEITGLPPGTWTVTIEKGSFVAEYEVELKPGEVTNLDPDEDCTPLTQGDLEIAVVTGQYDKIQELLDLLGLEYDTVKGTTGTDHIDFMRAPSELAKYDVIFFNCGMNENWTQYQDEIADNMKEFVQNGGSVYSSDWAYLLVEKTWPGENDFLGSDGNLWDARNGVSQSLTADVLDPAMITVLGRDTAQLNYDLDSWAAIEGANADILIEGDYQYWQGFQKKDGHGPLATRFTDGDGTVLYTTFHNESQTTGDMLLLLSEIILSL